MPNMQRWINAHGGTSGKVETKSDGYRPSNHLQSLLGREAYVQWDQNLPFATRYNSKLHDEAVLQKIAELTEHIEDDVDYADLLNTQKSAIM